MACWAQATRPPEVPASSAARPAAVASSGAGAPAGTAMERAQRAADSPLRAILEAAKLRRRIEPNAAAETDAAARRALALRPPAAGAARAELARAEPRAAVVPATPAPAPTPANVSAVAPRSVAAPALAAPAVPAAAPLLVADKPAITIRTLPGEALPEVPARSTALPPSTVAPLRNAPASSPSADLPRPSLPLAPTPVPAAVAAAAAAAPKLVHMVEPETTPRHLELLARPEVTVELTIRPDGSVSDVRVLPPVPRTLVPAITAAVEQWRYAPLPAPRPHRVVLVFKSGG
ncbi:MAG: energy transducer TonB [Burkholderiales bacterium]|nr:energy transducer TonB [Burkholderiales bacterium]